MKGIGYEIGGQEISGGASARRPLFKDLDFLITAGKRVGLVGPNGSGKTTLLRLLREEMPPTTGEIRKAEFLRVVYFDQNRPLDPDVTLRRALAPESDSVVYQERVVHVASWAARFLFTSEQLNQPVGRLSGGERARVLIAQLMLQPADVLLLDEPTNDLDIPTLEILEESLLEFTGALVLVTHDRYMLDRVSTVVLGLDGQGGAGVFADYSQWEAWMEERASGAKAQGKSQDRRPEGLLHPEAQGQHGKGPLHPDRAPSAGAKDTSATRPPEQGKKKLSYLEAREYSTMEQRIAEAEEVLRQAQAAAEDPAIATDAARLLETHQELEQAQKVVDELYARWAELEGKMG
jgi:ATP-binding cassette subfamily F protein uup